MRSIIYNSDSFKAMKDLPTDHFDLGIIDPPFGIDAPRMSMGTNESRFFCRCNEGK